MSDTGQPQRATLRASFVPSTYDAEARTVRVLLYPRGFARITRDPDDPWSGDLVEETFALDPGAVRMERARHGLPLLADHAWSAYEPGLDSLANVLGKIDDVEITSAGIEGRLRFSARSEIQWVVDDVAAGILDAVSIGAMTYRARREDRDGRPPLLTWIDWEPVEGSLTPVQAAPGARTQSASPQSAHKEQAMDPKTPTTQEPEGNAQPQTEGAKPEPKPNTASEVKLRLQLARTLRQIARGHSIDDDTVDEIVENATDEKSAKAALLDILGDRDKPSSARPAPKGEHGIDVVDDAGDKHIKLGAAAILKRVFGSERDASGGLLFDKALKDRRLSGIAPDDGVVEGMARMTLMDIGQDLLERQSGGRVTARHFRGLDQYERAKVVMGARTLAGVNTVANFPIIANTVVNVGLRQRYMERPQWWKNAGRKVNLPNFKSTTYIGAGRFPPLLDVDEQGTYQRGSWTESSLSLRLKKGGRIVSWSWELMLADDFNLLGMIMSDGALAATRYEGRKFRSKILANKVTNTATDFFSVANANISAVTGTPSVSVMKAALKAMAIQKLEDYPDGEVDEDGVEIDADHLILRPRWWMLGVDDMTDAEQLLGPGFVPTAATGVPTDRMRRLRDGLIEEPFLDEQATPFSVMFADPTELAAFQYGHLESEDGPVFDQRDGFENDGIDFKARDTFYIELVEPKAAVKITRS